MFKRKKFMALCATMLSGVSALGSFAPMAAFADVAKNGETTVTYESTPQPAEWGLSVPSAIQLDKTANEGCSRWGSGKLEIVSEDGSTFQDKAKDRTFSINGTPTLLAQGSDKFKIFENGNLNGKSCDAYSYALAQGATEPTFWPSGMNTSLSSLQNIEIVSKSDNSKVPSRILALGAHSGSANNPLWKLNLSNTIQWTATEKNV